MTIQTVAADTGSSYLSRHSYQLGPNLVRDRTGRLHLVYVEIRGATKYTQYRYSDDDGATWSAAETLATTTWSTYTTCICVDENDDPIIMWSYYESTGFGCQKRTSGSWDGFIPASHGMSKSTSTYGPILCLFDHTNNALHLFLMDRTNGLQHNWCYSDYAEWESDGSSIMDSFHDSTPDSGAVVGATLDDAGNIHLVACEEDSGNAKYTYYKWTYSTTSWSAGVTIESGIPGSGDMGYCSICIDDSGDLYVCAAAGSATYSGKANLRLWISTDNGANWSGEWVTTQTAKDFAPGRMAVTPLGEVYVQQGEHDTTDPVTVYKRTTGGSWSSVKLHNSNSYPLNCLYDGSLVYGNCASGFYSVLYDLGATPDTIQVIYDDATVFAEDAGTQVSATETFEFSEDGDRVFQYRSKTEGFEFSEAGSEVGELNRDTPTEGVEFSEAAGIIAEQSAVDTVEFGSSAHRAYAVEAEDEVEFDEEAKRLNFAQETVEFSETGVCAKERTASSSESVEFQEAAAHLPIEGCETDFVPSPTIPVDPDSVLYVYMQGPWATLTNTIRLTRPEFGDVRRSRLQVVVHRTRGGQRRVFKRTPTYRSLLMRFTGMSRKKLLELEYFLEQTAGEDIKFIDHNEHVWRGNILTSPADLSTEGYDQGEVALEFEGTVITS